MDRAPDVSIIIVGYNKLAILQTTVKSMAVHVTDPRCEIILVDNASQEPVAATIGRDFPSIRVIRNARNEGFGAANNLGAKHAKGKYLLFANNDLIVRGNPVPAMISMLQTSEGIGVVGCKLLNEDGSPQPTFFRFPSLPIRFMQMSGLKMAILSCLPRFRSQNVLGEGAGFVSGAFFLIEKELFHQVGGFDERFFMYLEDADLGYRLYCRGFKSVLIEGSAIIHLGRNYEDGANAFVYYRMNIGLLIFFMKNYHRWRFLALVYLSLFMYVIRFLATARGEMKAEMHQVYRKLLRVYWYSLAGDVDTVAVISMKG